MKRTATSLLAAATVCGLAWLVGYDFDSRGLAAFITAYFASAAAAFTYFSPGWKK